MPISYQVYPALKLVYARGTGTLCLTDVIDHLLCLANDADYQPPMLKLIDYRGMDLSDFSFTEARRVAAAKEGLLDHFQGERTAFIMDSDLGYGVGRQHQSLMGDTEIAVGVHRSFDEAIRWLGLGVTEQKLLSEWKGDAA